MTIIEPRDPFSQVVDERRRWDPEWYQWLRQLSTEVKRIGDAVFTPHVPTALNVSAAFGGRGTLSASLSVIEGAIGRRVTGINLATNTAYSQPIDGTGGSNVQSIIQTAWTACGLIYLPAGIYRIDSGLTGPLKDGAGIIGAMAANLNLGALNSTSFAGTMIRATFGSGTVITSGNSVFGPTFQNLIITRTVAPIGASYGLDMGTSCDHAYLNNLISIGHFAGIRLRICGYGFMENCRVENSTGHGIELTSQWQLRNVLAAVNAGDGFHVTGVAGGISVGQWSGLASFNNGGNGFACVATAPNPVFAIRLSNSFFGDDGISGVFIESFGTGGHFAHQLTHVSVENSGSSCFNFSANCSEVSMVNCTANNGLAHGVFSQCPFLSIHGGNFCGHVTGLSAGIFVQAGLASISGVSILGNDIGLAGGVGVTALSYYGNYLSGNPTPTDLGAVPGLVQAWGNY